MNRKVLLASRAAALGLVVSHYAGPVMVDHPHEERGPSGKDRSKTKAARKQRRSKKGRRK